MDISLFVARALLAATFLASGLSKLADRRGTVSAAEQLGMPAWLSGWLARVLPWLELLVAFALLVPPTAIVSSVAAAAMLVGFSVVIASNLARSRRVECHCFGQFGNAPISWKTLVRNLLLLGAAIAAIALSGSAGIVSSWSWITSTANVSMVALVTAATSLLLNCVMAVIVAQVIRQNGRILLRLDTLEDISHAIPGPQSSGGAGSNAGLPIGAAAPRFSLPGLYGEVLTLESQLAARLPTVLLFIDPGCAPCNALVPELATWQRDLRTELTIVIVSRRTAEENASKLAGHPLVGVLLQSDREVATEYSAFGTPSAVLIDPDGRIASKVVAGADAIRKLVHNVSPPQVISRL